MTYEYKQGWLWLEMEEPSVNELDETWEEYTKKVAKYASRPHHFVKGPHNWAEGQKVVEGELRFEMCNCGIGHDCPRQSGKWITPCKIAIPINI